MAEKSNVTFRRIRGRIVPIKGTGERSSDINRKRAANSLLVGGAAAYSVGFYEGLTSLFRKGSSGQLSSALASASKKNEGLYRGLKKVASKNRELLSMVQAAPKTVESLKLASVHANRAAMTQIAATGFLGKAKAQLKAAKFIHKNKWGLAIGGYAALIASDIIRKKKKK